MNTIDKIRIELDQAKAARGAGNEGRARVCARRAAGMAARVFLDRHGIGRRGDSAYELLQQLVEFPALDSDLRRAALHLTMRVSAAFTLPADVDLIADAQTLCSRLGE